VTEAGLEVAGAWSEIAGKCHCLAIHYYVFIGGAKKWPRETYSKKEILFKLKH